MGLYTEFVFAAELSERIPLNVLNILKSMTTDNACSATLINIPDHPFFRTERGELLACCDSAYFPGETHSCLQYNMCYYSLTIRSCIKNYDSEIELFLDWIKPYIITNGFLGYMRCEELNDPTLIYCDAYDHRIYLKKVANKLTEEVEIYG